jgi:pimeloyl-ACP methyl ester carboxylesterase
MFLSADMADGLNPMIFIHGLEGTSQGVKATMLRGLYPDILVPEFRGSLDERMNLLEIMLAEHSGWRIVGSSFGGLMGAIYTGKHPSRVSKLILLAPALIWPEFINQPPQPVDVPTVIYHGTEDEVIPLEPVKIVAEKVFLNLEFRVVSDDHGLYNTVHGINWHELLGQDLPG